MAPLKCCPYDPSSLFDAPFDFFPCPSCDCTVLSGAPHGPCLEPTCRFHSDQVAAWLRHPSIALPAAR